ncbi:MAG: hypothetical protein U0K57_06525 [Lachnospiraceae bacterium]|nr:hypothetical protein [Lachnospiraceae bacterium]
MKTKWAGLAVVIVVILITVSYMGISKRTSVTELNGYVGGEKIGFLEDEKIQDTLKKKYHLSLDYSKAGSLDMVTADQKGRDYLWPSSQTALELYRTEVGKPVRSEAIFNTPIVIYTRKAVADALIRKNIVKNENGVYTADLAALIKLVEDQTSWSSLGLNQLYGNVTVSSTDPVKSNSGNMFAGLLANTLAGGVATESNIDELLPRIKNIFERSGYMESSSADIFDEFLKMGVGSKPLVVGYENQLLEFSVENPDVWNQVKDDVVMLYPTPTVWSTHMWIALNDKAADAIDALEDKDIQKMAWERHGFRTGVSGAKADQSAFADVGVAPVVTQVGQMPNYRTMKKIIDALK